MATKPKFTKTATAAAQVIDAEATPTNEKPMLTRIDEWLDAKLAIPGVASWQRVASAWVLGLAAAAGTGYLIGHLASMLAVGALLMTGSIFIAVLILALALVLSWIAGGKAFRIVYSGVVHGEWTADVQRFTFRSA